MGWKAWDNSYLLYNPEDTEKRSWPDLLAVSSFVLSISQSLRMEGLSSVQISSPYSLINIQGPTNYWSGGIIRGIGRVSVTSSLIANGQYKSLQDAVVLYLSPAATLSVMEGNISMANGASIEIDGTLKIDSSTASNRVYIGQSQLLGISNQLLTANPEYKSVLSIYPARNWNGYFDNSIPLSEASGWYVNPECHPNCLVQPKIYLKNNGRAICDDHSNVTFIAPIEFGGATKLTIGKSAFTELASGGLCGNGVVVDIGDKTLMQLSGGNFLMAKACTIQGLGELTSTAGEHTLAQSIQAHITIEGGTLLWPLENGIGATIRFLGGLLIKNTGSLQLQPWSTNIVVNKLVQFQDQCLVQFPVIGTAAQPYVSDSDAPDLSPRGTLTAVDSMVFLGGTLQGKADFIAENIMELDGGVKNIRNLAKLINRGLARLHLIIYNNITFICYLII